MLMEEQSQQVTFPHAAATSSQFSAFFRVQLFPTFFGHLKKKKCVRKQKFCLFPKSISPQTLQVGGIKGGFAID